MAEIKDIVAEGPSTSSDESNLNSILTDLRSVISKQTQLLTSISKPNLRINPDQNRTTVETKESEQTSDSIVKDIGLSLLKSIGGGYFDQLYQLLSVKTDDNRITQGVKSKTESDNITLGSVLMDYAPDSLLGTTLDQIKEYNREQTDYLRQIVGYNIELQNAKTEQSVSEAAISKRTGLDSIGMGNIVNGTLPKDNSVENDNNKSGGSIWDFAGGALELGLNYLGINSAISGIKNFFKPQKGSPTVEEPIQPKTTSTAVEEPTQPKTTSTPKETAKPTVVEKPIGNVSGAKVGELPIGSSVEAAVEKSGASLVSRALGFGAKVGMGALRVISSGPALAAQVALTPSDLGDGTFEGGKNREIENINNLFAERGKTAVDDVIKDLNTIDPNIKKSKAEILGLENILNVDKTELENYAEGLFIDARHGKKGTKQRAMYDLWLQRGGAVDSSEALLKSEKAEKDSAKIDSSIYYGDTNSTINSLINQYTTNSDGGVLSPDSVRAKLTSQAKTAPETSLNTSNQSVVIMPQMSVDRDRQAGPITTNSHNVTTTIIQKTQDPAGTLMLQSQMLGGGYGDIPIFNWGN